MRFFRHKEPKTKALPGPAAPPETGLSAYETLCGAVYRRLLMEGSADDEDARAIIASCTAELAIDEGFDFQGRRQLQERVFNRFRRLDILQPLLDNDEITEIMVNGPEKIFYEKAGRLFRSPQRFENKEHLQNVVCGFFARYNEMLSLSRPLASVRLPDGSRAHAVLPPVAPDGPVLTIRKFCGIRPDLDTLIRAGFTDRSAAEKLISAVRQKASVIIGGGTGSGKTTLLNVLSAYIPEDERIITIEDSPELNLQKRLNWVRLTCREGTDDGTGAADCSLLIKNALRMRPDRIIVGEVRGEEAYDMLQAAMTGHPGTLCTIHGNSCEGMLLRLADLILSASRLRYDIILRHLAECFDYLVYISRDSGGRRAIMEICRIRQSEEQGYRLDYIFRREHETV